MDELLDVYDEAGNQVGTAPRAVCHGNPRLIHRVVHVVVSDCSGSRVLLQKRSLAKDIQPGKWDTAVGGHVDAGESVESAARRELREELGIDGEPEFWFESRIRNDIESENVFVYRLAHDGPFRRAPDEIDEVRFFPWAELADPAGRERQDFTPNLRRELAWIVNGPEQERKG